MGDASLALTPMEQDAVGLGASETATGAPVEEHPDFPKALEAVSALQLRGAHEEPRRVLRHVRMERLLECNGLEVVADVVAEMVGTEEEDMKEIEVTINQNQMESYVLRIPANAPDSLVVERAAADRDTDPSQVEVEEDPDTDVVNLRVQQGGWRELLKTLPECKAKDGLMNWIEKYKGPLAEKVPG